MIWMFLIYAFVAVSAYLLLKQQRVRNHLAGAAALAWSISLKTADALFKFMLLCVAALAAVSSAFALGLVFRALGWTDFGNGIVTLTFTVVALALGIITAALGVISSATARAITHTKTAISQAGNQTSAATDGMTNEGLDKAIESLKAKFPQQEGLLNAIQASIGGWFSALFSLQGVRALLAIPHTILLDTMEGVAKAVNQMAWAVLGALLWLFIAGFVAMWMPESAHAFWLIAIPYGLLILLGIGAYKGKEWGKAHNLPDLWWAGYRVVRLGVRAAILAVVVGALYAAAQPALPHWLAGARNMFLIKEEQYAKMRFGPRFDQRIYEVAESGHAYSRVIRPGASEPVIESRLLQKGAILWKTDREPFEYKPGVRYAEYALQATEGLIEPSETRVLFPESKVRAQPKIEFTTVLLDSGTVYRPDSLGVASDQRYVVSHSWTAEATNVTDYVNGAPYVLCRTYDRGRVYKIWVRREVIKRASST